MSRFLRLFFSWLCVAFAMNTHAENFKAFDSQSRTQIEKAQQGKAFVLAFWSVDCPYCIQEMQSLGDVLRKHPQVKLITVCTDATGQSADINKALEQAHLPAHERWQFAETDEERLRYNVDKSWGGELPRTYFYDAKHQVSAISGRPQMDWLTAWFLIYK